MSFAFLIILVTSVFVSAGPISSLGTESETYNIEMVFLDHDSVTLQVNDEARSIDPIQTTAPYSTRKISDLEFIIKDIRYQDFVGGKQESTIWTGITINLTNEQPTETITIDGTSYDVEMTFIDVDEVQLTVNGENSGKIDFQQFNSPYYLYPYAGTKKIQGLDIVLKDILYQGFVGGEQKAIMFFGKDINFSLEDCAGQGEWYDFTDSSTPNQCCVGLVDVHSTDSLSVADECYWIGTASGYPGGVCSDCGNGICEDIESVCGCAEDCVGEEKSSFNTVQQFCDENYEQYCGDLPEGMELELCNLCGSSPDTCVDECSISGEKICVGDNSYKTCGDHDSDDCLEYDNGVLCSFEESCSEGECIAKSTPEPSKECDQIGIRQSGKYCSTEYKLVSQKANTISCENNFECKNNICSEGNCASKVVPPTPNNKIFWIIGIILGVILIIVLAVIFLRPKQY